jgi:hypothetical protein
MNNKILNELFGTKKSKKSYYDPLKSMGFGTTKSTSHNKGNDILGMGYSGKSKKSKGMTDILGPMKGMQHKHIGSHKGPAIIEKKTPNVDLRKLMGYQGHPHPSSILGDKVTSKQKKALSKDPWADWDGDGVVNGLDCDPMNPNKHGFFTKAKNLLTGKGYREDTKREKERAEFAKRQKEVTKEVDKEAQEREYNKNIHFDTKSTYDKPDAEVRKIYDEERAFEEAQHDMPQRNLAKEQFNKEMDVYAAKIRRDKAYAKVQEGPSAEGGFKEAQEKFNEFEIAQGDLKKAAESYNKFDDEIKSVQNKRQESERAEQEQKAQRKKEREEKTRIANEKFANVLDKYGKRAKSFYDEKAIEAGFESATEKGKVSYARPLQRLTGYAFLTPEQRAAAKEADVQVRQQQSIKKLGEEYFDREVGGKLKYGIESDLRAVDSLGKSVPLDVRTKMKENILQKAARQREIDTIKQTKAKTELETEAKIYQKALPVRMAQIQKDIEYTKQQRSLSRFNIAKQDLEYERIKQMQRRGRSQLIAPQQAPDVVSVLREQQGPRVGGLSDFGVLPKYNPSVSIPAQRQETYQPEKPKFVYRQQSDVLGKKDSRLRTTEESNYRGESEVMKVPRSNKYVSGKVLRGYERVYVGKGAYVRKGRRRIKPTWDKSKRPKRKFTPYVTTYGTKKAYGQ